MARTRKKDLAAKQVRTNEELISILLGIAIVIVLGVISYNYFTRLNKNTVMNFSEKSAFIPSVTPTPVNANKKTTTYEIKEGDSLWTIAEKTYNSGYYWVDIANANKLSDPNHIEAGQILKIPEITIKKGDINGEGISTTSTAAITSPSYLVEKEDNLWNIAVRACGDGYKWEKIKEDNRLDNPDIIHSGDVLKIDCK